MKVVSCVTRLLICFHYLAIYNHQSLLNSITNLPNQFKLLPNNKPGKNCQRLIIFLPNLVTLVMSKRKEEEVNQMSSFCTLIIFTSCTLSSPGNGRHLIQTWIMSSSRIRFQKWLFSADSDHPCWTPVRFWMSLCWIWDATEVTDGTVPGSRPGDLDRQHLRDLHRWRNLRRAADD